MGWSYELTDDFIALWLEDFYLVAPSELELLRQMDDHAASWGVDAEAFTDALVRDLDARDDDD